jgi:hypothetical protein
MDSTTFIAGIRLPCTGGRAWRRCSPAGVFPIKVWLGAADMSIVTLRPASLLVIGLLSVPAWGLDPKLALTQFGHDVWTTSNGLPQDSVRAIAQTADGYLWFATTDGLARFDGVNFTVFNDSNTPVEAHSTMATLLARRMDRCGSAQPTTGCCVIAMATSRRLDPRACQRQYSWVAGGFAGRVVDRHRRRPRAARRGPVRPHLYRCLGSPRARFAGVPGGDCLGGRQQRAAPVPRRRGTNIHNQGRAAGRLDLGIGEGRRGRAVDRHAYRGVERVSPGALPHLRRARRVHANRHPGNAFRPRWRAVDRHGRRRPYPVCRGEVHFLSDPRRALESGHSMPLRRPPKAACGWAPPAAGSTASKNIA